jgi:hypothetical protein
MAFFAFSGGEKTKPIQTQFKANLVVLPPRTPSARRYLMCKNSRWCSWLGDFVSSAFSANSAVKGEMQNKANSVVLPPRTPSARRFLMCKNSHGCNWLQTMILQILFSLRSPRSLRLIGFEKTNPIYLVQCSAFRVLRQDLERLFEKTKPILSFSVLSAADCVWIPAFAGMTNNKYPRLSALILRLRSGRRLRLMNLKKQSQFIRIAYCVLRIAERKKAKMSVNLVFIRVNSWLI